ncbi:MAG: ATP-dependent RNA helicase HrpA [Pseudomonadota bacterium]
MSVDILYTVQDHKHTQQGSELDSEPTSLTNRLSTLHNRMDALMTRDQFSVSKRIQALRHELTRDASNDTLESRIAQLEARCERSWALVKTRQTARPAIDYPTDLPISIRRDDIAKAIAQHQVVIVAGETGSGKTTQLPKICLELGRGVHGLIGHTQPRRIAAHSVANRIADELHTPLGECVGYQVRFKDHTNERTLVKLMTDGILLAEIKHDRFLSRYDTLIIDEAHERSLNIDFIMGYLKKILPKRPDLKVIITSATIDLERFSAHFNNAPVIEVSGRSYPVTTIYRPMDESNNDLTQAVTDTVGEILAQSKKAEQRGDILVFLSGEKDIRDSASSLKHAAYPQLDVIPLYARLSAKEQQKIFKKHTGRRVILSTNVAETSLTVPGIRYVIDTGVARISRYSYRSKIQRLPIERISQASANQRQGRCGRVSDGVCYRLYDEQDFASRPEFTDAEIKRTNLAAVILQMLNLRMGDINQFPFIDPPDPRVVNDGFKLLHELHAVNEHNKLTPLGRQLMQLPVDPKLGRMILAAASLGCLNEILIISSGLSIQDPRERPSNKRQAADEKHRQFKHDRSDFMSYIALWNYAEQQRSELSHNQWRKQCAKLFLSHNRMREWRDLHHQLSLAIKSLKLIPNRQDAPYDTVHRALLTGLLGNIGRKTPDNDYLGARNRRFLIFPGSSQSKKKPNWLMAGHMLETSKVFAHQVALIEPDWVIECADHLIKRQQYEPHYHVKSGKVKAFERCSLYGVVLNEKSTVLYANINPVEARDIFIRSALVEERYLKSMKAKRKRIAKGSFFHRNNTLKHEVATLESKSRRRDILVDDDIIYDFYNERIPEHVVSLTQFEIWRKQAEVSNPNVLHLSRNDIMQHNAHAITESQFPDTLEWNGATFELRYHFEPGHPADGVSIRVPIDALHRLPEKRLEWLIPGLLREKCIAMLKSLPKQWRKHIVPIPSQVDQLLTLIHPDDSALCAALQHQIKRLTLVDIPNSAWDQITIDDYYRFNIQVIDERGHVIEQNRRLDVLKEIYQARIQTALDITEHPMEQEGITRWDFGPLKSSEHIQQGGMNITAYPTLTDNTHSVSLTLSDTYIKAIHHTTRGVCRLAALTLNPLIKPLKKELLKGQDFMLSVLSIGNRERVVDDIIMTAIHISCFQELDALCDSSSNASKNNTPDKNASDTNNVAHKRLPRTEDEFNVCLELGKNKIIAHAREIEAILLETLQSVVKIKKRIKQSKNPLAIALAVNHINTQLDRLLYSGFLFETPFHWLTQYPRYLNAISIRLEKTPAHPSKDTALSQEIDSLSERYEQHVAAIGKERALNSDTLITYRWMLEEYRVSAFAQTLKTLMPVSPKRLNKLWQEINTA